MADQMERLIAAVEDVSRKLTRLSTYEHLIVMGRGSTAVSASISALLGILINAVELVGTLTSTSGANGAMTVVPAAQMDGVTDALSSVTGILNVATELLGSITGTSTADIRILNSVQFAGSIAGSSSASAGFFNAVRMAGNVDAVTITSRGHLDIN